MSVVKLTTRPWYVRLAPVYVWASASLAVAFSLYILLPLPLVLLFSPIWVAGSVAVGYVFTRHLRERLCKWLYPADHHDFSTIRPKRLILEDGRLMGFTCYRVVRCGCCKKRYRFIPVGEDHLTRLLREFFWRKGRRSDDLFRSDKALLAGELKGYGIRLETEYTAFFRRFYSLKYGGSHKVLTFYRPPKELEKMTGIRRAVLQVLDKASGGDENGVIYLLAVKIKIDDSHYTMSTHLLRIMKNGHVWLNQTPHMLPPRLDDHLAWIMGLNPGERMEADRGEAVWRPPRRIRGQG